MLHTEFEAPEPSGSEEDFRVFFPNYVFLSFKRRTPGVKPFCTLGPLFEQFW